MFALLRSRMAQLAILYALFAVPALAQTPSWSLLVQQPVDASTQVVDSSLLPQAHSDIVPDHSGANPAFLPIHTRSAVTLEWEARLDGHGNNDYATGIALGPDGSIYVTGWSIVVSGNNQYVTARYTPDGEELWRATYDEPAGMWDESYAIAVDADGNAFVTGRAFGAGGFRTVTVKYSPDGEELWANRSTIAGYSKGIDVDSEGNAYVAGIRFVNVEQWDFVLTKYTPDGEEAWVETIPAPGADPNNGIPIVVGDDDTIYIGGAIHSADTGNAGVDYYVLRYDPDGNQLWNHRYAVPAGVTWYAVMTVDSAGNAYIGGGSNDRRFIKITAEGDFAWDAFIGGEGGAVAALATDADGNVFVGGVTGCGSGIGCFSVTKYDGEGNVLWEQGYPGYGNLVNIVTALAVDDAGHVYATGRSEQAVGIATDYVTAKYHADGGELWLQRYVGGEFVSSAAIGVVVDSEQEAAYVTGFSISDILTLKYVSGEGTLTITPGEVDFGTLFLGESADAEVQLHNSTMANVSVDIGLSNEAVGITAVPSGTLVLAPGEAITITLTFEPVDAGTVLTVLQVTGDSGLTLEVFITGNALVPPTASVSPDKIFFTLDPVSNPVESQTATLSNTAVAGAADLDFQVTYSSARVVEKGTGYVGDLTLRHTSGLQGMNGVPEVRSYTQLSGSGISHQRGNQVIITHSASMEPEPEFSVACGVQGSHTVQNSFWRVFELGQFPQIAGAFTVTSVDIGVEMVSDAFEASLVLYRLNGPLSPDNLVQVSETFFILEPGGPYVISVDVESVEFNNTEVLVVEWHIPNGEEVFANVYPGSNPYGQTSPTYFSTDGCDIDGIVDMAELGFPDQHWVLGVNGETGVGVLTITPEQGNIAAGGSTDLTITADASTLDDGHYPLVVSIWTNDPQHPVLTIEVDLVVGTVSNDGDGMPLTFDLQPNYPNPFTEVTTIAFEIPRTEHVTIEVIDLTGRRVAVLVDEQLEAARHEITWNANGLASGIYLYRMQAGSFTKTLRTTLVR